MNQTLKITIAVSAMLLSFAAGALISKKSYKIDLEKFGKCLQPYSGEVMVLDKDGKEQKAGVVLIGAIAECIK